MVSVKRILVILTFLASASSYAQTSGPIGTQQFNNVFYADGPAPTNLIHVGGTDNQSALAAACAANSGNGQVVIQQGANPLDAPTLGGELSYTITGGCGGVTIIDYRGASGWSCYVYSNSTTYVRGPCVTAGSLSGVVFTNPTSPQTVNNVLTLAGTNGVIYADSCGDANPPSWCSGSDGGAWANAAFAYTGIFSRVVVAFAGPVTISTPIVVGVDRILSLANGLYTQTASIILGNYASVMGAGQFATNLNLTGSVTNAIDASNVTSLTSCTIASNVVTLATSPNVVYNGASEVIAGFSGGCAFLNGQTLTASATGLSESQFEAPFTHANVSTTSDTGTATNPIVVGQTISGFQITTNANAQDGIVVGNALGSTTNFNMNGVYAVDAIANNIHLHNISNPSNITNISAGSYGVGVAGAFSATCLNMDNVFNVGAGNTTLTNLFLFNCGKVLAVTSGGNYNFKNSYMFDALNSATTCIYCVADSLNNSLSYTAIENLAGAGPDALIVQSGSTFPNLSSSNTIGPNNVFIGPNSNNPPEIQVGDSAHTNAVANTVITGNILNPRGSNPNISLVHAAGTTYNANCVYASFGAPCQLPIVNTAGDSTASSPINFDNSIYGLKMLAAVGSTGYYNILPPAGNLGNNNLTIPKPASGTTDTFCMASGAGGGDCSAGTPGTVTSFSASDITNLFAQTVGTPTTTPALSYALKSAAAGTIPNATSTTVAGWTATPTLGIPGVTNGSLALVHGNNGTTLVTTDGGSVATVTILGVTDTLVNLASAQTLTSKSIAGSEINSSVVGVTYGGTGANLSATGGTSQVLKQTSSGGAVTVSQLACSDLSNAGTGCSGSASAVGANPTATATGTAIDGSAVTFMRSDAAPAINTAASGTLGLASPDNITIKATAGVFADQYPTSGSLMLSAGNGAVPTAYGGTVSAGNVLTALSAAGAGSFQSFGLTGNSTLVETTSGGLLTPSILPLATSSAFGAVKVDNTTITASAGVISAVAALPCSLTEFHIPMSTGGTGCTDSGATSDGSGNMVATSYQGTVGNVTPAAGTFTTLAATTVSATGAFGAWTQTTPTPTCTVGSGTLSSLLRTSIVGKTATFHVEITVTAAGTCAQYISLTMPFTSLSFAMAPCVDQGTSGTAGFIRFNSSSSTGLFANYLGASIAATGAFISCNGVIEIP